MDPGRRTEAQIAAFHEAVLHAALAAEASAGRHIVPLRVAGVRIDLAFAGSRLMEEFLPALRHVVCEPSDPPSAVLHVWDGHSTGTRMQPPPCSRGDFTNRGDLWGFAHPRYRTAFHWVEYSVNCFDNVRGIGTYWVQTADTLPYWTKASPLRTLLHWTLERAGAQLLHAAAVGTPEGAVLITGRGGVGKSSTALASLARGLRYVADDYLAVRLDPCPTVHSLYSTAKLNPEDVTHFPTLAPLVRNLACEEGEKAVLHLYPHFAAQIVQQMPLRLLVTPRFANQTDSQLLPIDPVKLRRAAAFTTLSQLPYAGQQTQDFVDAMIDRVPGFELVLGSDRDKLVQALCNALGQSDDTLRSLATAQRKREERPSAPLVSVVVPVFNGAGFVEEAIGNVLAQRYPSLEIIVVDDGSTDGLQQVLGRLPVDVRLLRQDNAGPASARNRGIRDASGECIAFLDVDDLWPQGSLARLAAALNADPELMVVHGHAQLLVLYPESGEYRPEGNPAESFPYYIGAGLYRRHAFETVGLFDPSLMFAEDTDWYTRLKESGLKFERVPEVTLHVRRHGANVTAKKTPEQLSATSIGAFRKALQRARRATAAPTAVDDPSTR
jgi:hypothetical protein